MKYRLIDEMVLNMIVDILDDVQFDAASDSDMELVEYCTFLISELILSDLVFVEGPQASDQDDDILKQMKELSDKLSNSFNKLTDGQLNRLLDALHQIKKPDSDEARDRMTKHRKHKFTKDNVTLKPKRDVNSKYMAGFTKEELTHLSPEELDEVFDMYNENKKPKSKTYSFDQIMKELDIKPLDD